MNTRIPIRSMTGDESGFTLQEMLVVIVVSSLLVSLCLSLFLFSGKLFKSWERKTELTNAVGRTLYVMAMDIQRARRIESFVDSSLVLNRGTRTETTYRFTRGRVLRDGVPVVGDSLILISVNVDLHDDHRSADVSVSGLRGGALHRVSGFVAAKPSSRAEFLESFVENP